MAGPFLDTIFRFSGRVLEMNAEGVTQQQSLSVPAGGGNCFNWIAGHILLYRNRVHQLVGIEPAWPDPESAAYERGQGGLDPDRALPLSILLERFGRSQQLLVPALGALDAAALAAPTEPSRRGELATVGDRLAFLGFHESYHAGQTGLLRRTLGLAGAIP